VEAPAFVSELDFDDAYWDPLEAPSGRYKKVSNDALQTLTGSRTVQWTRNPVWCFYDLLTNARYGGGLRITSADINETALDIAAKFCHEHVDRYEDDDSTQEHRCRLDIIFDSRIKLGDAAKHILATFRGVSFESGQIIIRVDKAEDPAQIFTGGNTLGGSFSHSWPALSQIHNTVQVSFRNENDDYEERTVAAETDDGNPEKVRLDYLRGVTRRSQTKRLSRYRLLAESRQKVRVSFKAATDALSCQAFDVIGVANLVPAWGASNGAVTEINIGEKWFTMNRDVTLNILPSGEAYYVNTRKGTTSDVIDSLVVASGAGEYPAGTRIYTVAAFDSTTTVGSPVSIGELNVVYKPFRITKINHQADGTTSIEALEYDEAVYSDSGPADEPVNYSTLPIPSKLPAPVTGLTAVNSPGAKNSTVLVSWSRPLPSTVRPIPTPEFGPWRNAEIHVSPDAGGNYIKYGSSEGDSFQIDGLVPGATYLITVVSVSGFGMKTPLATSPTVEIKVKVGAPPPNVTGLRLRGQGDSEFVGRDPIFQWKAASGSSAYGLLGPLGGGNLSKDANARWYQVEIWTSGVRRRQEVVDKTEYVYSFEKNLNDHAGIARRVFEIRVWALDQNNTPSALPATMVVMNPRCVTPTGFSVISNAQYFFLSWNPAPEEDVAGYVIRRAETDLAWTAMDETYTVKIGPDTTATISNESVDSGKVYYFTIAAFDTFDDVNNSTPATAGIAQNALAPSASATGTASQIAYTDIGDFPAGKIFVGIPLLQGEAWTGNSPAAGRVAWNEHNLFFSQQDPGPGIDNQYVISAGNTPVSDPGETQYIYWIIPASYPVAGASSYQVGTEHPGSPPSGTSIFKTAVLAGSPEPGGFLIATNTQGIATPG
ncbi:MAG: hypothetical protein KAJ19_12615, partial [Gammaproteobacteria bacterium]|nr:hypothetical protein [Gammaproteobacteria bacterium]